MPETPVHGDVEAGYGAVADAFAANFAEHGERGAAFAAYHDGHKVVDLWGGVADRERGVLWQEDTLQLVFSGTKGLTAGCMLLLIDDGLLDPAAAVSHYWPEFAAEGKGQITVAEMLSHRAGLAATTTPLSAQDLLDGARMADLLAAQKPYWVSEERFAYHAITYGWLCDALIRRLTGLTTGQLFAKRIAQPLGIEAWIGLPSTLEPRVSTLDPEGFDAVLQGGADPAYAQLIYENPPLFETPLFWNTPECHAAEIPAANGIATARAIARFYACLADEGALDGVRVCSPQAILAAREQQVAANDAFTGEACAYGLGFALQSEQMWFGPPSDAFGHGGAGGSSHGAWPAHRVGYSYCMNHMREEESDYRARRLLAALAQAIDA